MLQVPRLRPKTHLAWSFTFFRDFRLGASVQWSDCLERKEMSVKSMAAPKSLTARLIDSLHMEAMLLTDEVRAYFDDHGRAERNALPPMLRLSFSCESLKVTNRLTQVIAWLAAHRRAAGGSDASAFRAAKPLMAVGSDPHALTGLPEAARSLIVASCDLYMRIRWLDERMDRSRAGCKPARTLPGNLEDVL